MDGAVVVQVTQQGKTDWKAEQAHNAQQLDPCKHTCQRYHRVKPDLAADDFGLDDIPDDRYKQIDNKQSQRQLIIAGQRGNHHPGDHDSPCPKNRKDIKHRNQESNQYRIFHTNHRQPKRKLHEGN